MTDDHDPRLTGFEYAQQSVVDSALGQLHWIVEEIDQLRGWGRDVPEPMGIVNLPGLSRLITNLCTYQAACSLALFDQSNRPRRGESRPGMRARIERVAWVSDLCRDLDVSALLDREFRNRILHFDEHAIELALEEPIAAWMMDFGISHRHALRFDPRTVVRYCRVYVIREDVVLHLGAELHLGRLREAAVGIIERLT